MYGGSNWMGAINSHTKFWDLVLPGTHNSHAYEIQGASKIASALIQCHELNIYEQLKMGIRCIDLRLGKYGKDWYCYHWAATIPMKDALIQIRKFSDEQPSELIIVKVKGDWDANDGKYQGYSGLNTLKKELGGRIETYFGTKLVGSAFNVDESVQNITSSGQQILLIFGEDTANQIGKVSLEISTSWSSTRNSDPKQVIANCTSHASGLNERHVQYSSNRKLRELDCHVTLEKGTDLFTGFFGSAFGSGLYAEAQKSNDELRGLLGWSGNDIYKSIKKSINVVCIDYPDQELVSKIYSMNF